MIDGMKELINTKEGEQSETKYYLRYFMRSMIEETETSQILDRKLKAEGAARGGTCF
jgi:hypothetical protein